jgi:hypothetical protein
MMPSKLPNFAYITDVTRHDFAAAVARMKATKAKTVNTGLAMTEETKTMLFAQTSPKRGLAARRS